MPFMTVTNDYVLREGGVYATYGKKRLGIGSGSGLLSVDGDVIIVDGDGQGV